MTWAIHHINVPSSDVRRDARFFRDGLGLIDGKWIYPPDVGDLHHDEDGIAYFGIDNGGLHVVRLIPEFAAEQGFLHNPTVGGHIALNISDLSGFVARCRKKGLPLTDAGAYAMAGIHQTYVYDPAGNLVEVNSTVEPPASRNQDPAAGIRITGIVIPAHELDRSASFYGDMIGLGGPDRSGQETTGHVTFRNAGQSVHVACPDLDFPCSHNPTLNGCFRIATRNLDETAKRLSAAGVPFSEVDLDRYAGGRVLYTLTPSARLIALEETSI